MRSRLETLLACALTTSFACGPTELDALAKEGRGLAGIADDEFLRAVGTELQLGDRAVRFVGVNAGIIHGRSTRESMPRVLESMSDDMLGLARVWALGESEGDEDWRREVAFRTGRDAWVEESFVHLDHVLAEARERRVRVILVFVNRWGDRGGLPQYARWSGVEPRYRNLLPSEEAHVLASDEIRAMVLEHVERVVTRVNTVTGIAYRDDPTIAAWELFNEMGSRTCAMQDALVPWVQQVARRIRELDSNHLIAAGHIGYNSEQSLRFWREIHALDEIGYADTHGYPQNLLDATDPDRLGAWLGHRAAEAERLEKPIIVGEVGVPRRDPAFDRVAWLRRFLEHAEHNGSDAVLVWIYRGDERDDPHGIWAWGPFAEETAPLRHMLTDASKRWLREEPRDDADAPMDFPLGLDRIRPYVRGDAEGDELVLDPWQLAEGCVNDQSAWLEYVIPWSDAHESFELRFADARRGHVRVKLDRQEVGSWRDGRFERNEFELPAGNWVWLRLEAGDEAGRELLRAFTRALPDRETIRVRAR